MFVIKKNQKQTNELVAIVIAPKKLYRKQKKFTSVKQRQIQRHQHYGSINYCFVFGITTTIGYKNLWRRFV